jgi:hypothetical protein
MKEKSTEKTRPAEPATRGAGSDNHQNADSPKPDKQGKWDEELARLKREALETLTSMRTDNPQFDPTLGGTGLWLKQRVIKTAPAIQPRMHARWTLASNDIRRPQRILNPSPGFSNSLKTLWSITRFQADVDVSTLRICAPAGGFASH